VQFGGGLHQAQGHAAKRNRNGPQQHRQQHAEQQALQQDLPQRGAITASGGLRGEAGGAHAQKTHHPGQEDIQAGAHGDGAQLMGVGQMADDSTVDQRYQRHGDIGQDHGGRQRPHPAMGRTVAPVG